jgi:UDP-N-acetylenolpyruvoylglucosamine reductase
MFSGSRKQYPVYTVGSGSNVIWSDCGYSGLVLKNEIHGLYLLSRHVDQVQRQRPSVGKLFDEAIAREPHMYPTDMECLSLIPRTCRSGTCCQEVSQMLHSADVFDTKFREVLEANARNLNYRFEWIQGRIAQSSCELRLHRQAADRTW